MSDPIIDNIQEKLNDLYTHLSQTSSNEATELVSKFSEMIKIELIKENKNKDNFYIPPLKKGQVVQVRFIGQGTVLTGKHFAIIWYVQPREGQVVVLPMTSKIKTGQEIFDLGSIENLHSSVNVVLFHQPITVSRKSIHIWTKKSKNSSGNPIIQPIKLNDFQILHMTSMFRYSQLNEKDLFFKLVFDLGVQLPKNIPQELLQNLNKHIKVIIKSEELLYKLNHQTEFTKIDLVTPNIDFNKRLDIFKGLFSTETKTRQATEKIIENLLISI